MWRNRHKQSEGRGNNSPAFLPNKKGIMKFPLLHGDKGTKKNLNGKEKGRVSPPQLAQSLLH
jgi:hypothetical protein